MAIDVLPDDVLVDTFNFYVKIDDLLPYSMVQNFWLTLVHVCCRWRYLVFSLPRHLNLRLAYGGNRPMSEMPDTWPVLPIILTLFANRYSMPDQWQRWDNVLAALESEHYNRIYEIHIRFDRITNSRWQRFAAVMQKPFPELTHLELWRYPGVVPVLPDSFLGGSAPRLQEFTLRGIPFSSMPKLLLSANRLVKLDLCDIPGSGYVSPDAMAAALAVVTRLESLHLQFYPPRSPPNLASQPPPTRFVLPALTEFIFIFNGVYEYLEDLLARIDAPRLYCLHITFCKDIDYDLPQLHRLIDHAEEFKAFNHAEVLISEYSIRLSLYPKTEEAVGRRLELELACEELDRDLSYLARFCNSSFPLISTLEELAIREHDLLIISHWRDDIADTRWVGLLDPFTAVKSLYLSHRTAQRVCRALQELSGARATEVLPALRNLSVRGFSSLRSVQEVMRPFIAARQLSGRPMVVEHWKD
jgi:hypothetical protein